MPSLTALFTDTTGQFVGDLSPFLSTQLLDQSEKGSILLFSPGSFNQVWVKYFLPSV